MTPVKNVSLFRSLLLIRFQMAMVVCSPVISRSD